MQINDKQLSPLFWVCFVGLFLFTRFSLIAANTAQVVWRTKLKEVGQSGVCVQGDNLYLTIHKPLKGEGANFRSSDIIGQCFDKRTGKLKWEVPLPGTSRSLVLDSWHDGTSLTPLADDKHVLFHNLSGMLLCCDLDGKLLWKRSFQGPKEKMKDVSARMFLYGSTVIVALPDTERGVPLYRLHAIDLDSGKDVWVSPVRQHFATQYHLDRWQNKPVIVTSLLNLGHWKFTGAGRGFLISPANGKPLYSFPLKNVGAAQKHQLTDGLLVTTYANPKKKLRKERATYRLIDPTTGKIVKEITFVVPHKYYFWTGTHYEVRPYEPKFRHRYLNGRKGPTPCSMHSYSNRVFYFSSVSASIGCLDLKTGQATMVDVPMQILNGKTAWNVDEVQFGRGEIRNANGKIVSTRARKQLRGPHWAGFGHQCPPYPVRFGDKLYWQGAIGVLYRIDLTGEFSPDRVSWTAINAKNQVWSFGEPAIDDDGIYVRTQSELVRLRWE